MIQSVQRAISILETIGSEAEPIGVHDLSRMLGLKVSTLHSLIRTLAALGYLSRDSRGKYMLGDACLDLSAAVEGRQALRRIAPTVMADLCRRIHENVFLAARRGAEISFLRMVAADSLITVSDDSPGPDTAHALASGKVLMAYAPADWVADYIAAGRLRKYTDKTICSPAALRACLAKVRQDELAITDEEMSEGIVALAVPVRGHRGRVIAALATSMPKLRYESGNKEEIVRLLREGAATIFNAISGARRIDAVA
jgi:DNA-binding IclR family transcriptional regulator